MKGAATGRPLGSVSSADNVAGGEKAQQSRDESLFLRLSIFPGFWLETKCEHRSGQEKKTQGEPEVRCVS